MKAVICNERDEAKKAIQEEECLVAIYMNRGLAACFVRADNAPPVLRKYSSKVDDFALKLKNKGFEIEDRRNKVKA